MFRCPLFLNRLFGDALSCTLKLERVSSPLANKFFLEEVAQGVTKRCCLSLLTNIVLPYMSPNALGWGGWGAWGGVFAGSQPMSTHGAQINFGDLTPYLTYDVARGDKRSKISLGTG